ncbi:15260_t:CDS:1, partial [Entrophospora sp. SA101]
RDSKKLRAHDARDMRTGTSLRTTNTNTNILNIDIETPGKNA